MDISPSETAEIPEFLLSELLQTPLLPSKRSKGNNTYWDDGLRIAQVRSAGDVLHLTHQEDVLSQLGGSRGWAEAARVNTLLSGVGWQGGCQRATWTRQKQADEEQ
ncbi:hypothetical protein NEOLEDRAFT_1129946 [Neolentinus lepideus HHB14362 ss-1]|uniref:Uncharacterized protein n=1 Tax=Neolentinus lepideus HHB14362 ss-1 TaxID=1314782 RepID=A0A165UE77_9AGAM|nr:hypothetical protein NEOLEDRAFT_1129946 [Neolentinus lepideus HHB14362 ss-1]